MIEFTKNQQLMLLVASVMLGVVLGVLFEVFNALARFYRGRRRLVFLLDAIYFAVASLVTFYFSLAVMDGRLHPLLFCGCALGLLIQHIAIGRFVCECFYRGLRLLRTVVATVNKVSYTMLSRLKRGVVRCFAPFFARKTKNKQKSRKKSTFFQKKS